MHICFTVTSKHRHNQACRLPQGELNVLHCHKNLAFLMVTFKIIFLFNRILSGGR